MKIGKVSESVLKRSILKQIKHNREEVLNGAGIGKDCAILEIADEEAVVLSTNPVTVTSKGAGELAVHISANNVAAKGAEVIGILLSFLLPESFLEPDIKGLMKEVCAACDSLHIQVLGGHTEITDAVNRPVVSVTGVGKLGKDSLLIQNTVKPGQDIVLTKWIGIAATAILAREREEELLRNFSKYLIEEAKDFASFLSAVPEAATAVKSGVSAMHDVSEGGIFGALWELAQSADVGLEVDLKKLPVKQTTIEICEYFDISPYGVKSNGSMLMVTDNGHDLVKELEKQNINAAVIGKIKDGNDRLVINGEETRYLEPAKSDELHKALAGYCE